LDDPIAIDPDQLPFLVGSDPAGYIDQASLRRDRELPRAGVRPGIPHVRRLHDTVNQRNRTTGECESRGVERDCHQCPSADEHEVTAGHVAGVCAIVEQDLVFARDE
jgi:hypothetical protein